MTNRGRLQGRKLGEELRKIIDSYNARVDDDIGGTRIGEINIVYSSPMMRCVQTAAEAIIGYTKRTGYNNCERQELRVNLENGLMESMNEKWFRSWCLSDSNGTWGGKDGDTYKNGIYPAPIEDLNDVDDRAKDSCQKLLLSSPNNIKIKYTSSSDEENGGEDMLLQYLQHLTMVEKELDQDDSLSSQNKQRYSILENSELKKLYIHHPSANQHVYQQEFPYCWGSFETKAQLEKRILETIEKLAQKHPNQTILILSHGSPCTKLYELLTGDSWVTHGECTYACFSIYQRQSTEQWVALDINNSCHVQAMEKELNDVPRL